MSESKNPAEWPECRYRLDGLLGNGDAAELHLTLPIEGDPRLNPIPRGVTAAYFKSSGVNRYAVSLYKGALFEWDDILPGIVAAVGMTLKYRMVPHRKDPPPATPSSDAAEFAKWVDAEVAAGRARTFQIPLGTIPFGSKDELLRTLERMNQTLFGGSDAAAPAPAPRPDGRYLRTDGAGCTMVFVRGGWWKHTVGDRIWKPVDAADYTFVVELSTAEWGPILAEDPLPDSPDGV